jgi:hypothetical protein
VGTCCLWKTILTPYMVIVLAVCFLRLVSGKVIILRITVLALNYYFIMMNVLLSDYYPYDFSPKGYGMILFDGSRMIILTLILLIVYHKLPNGFLIFGIDNVSLVDTIKRELSENNLKYKDQIDGIRIFAPDEIQYRLFSFAANAGVWFLQEENSDAQKRPSDLHPIMKKAVDGCSLNRNGVFLLIILVAVLAMLLRAII